MPISHPRVERAVGRTTGVLALAGMLIAFAVPSTAQAAGRPACVSISHSAGGFSQRVRIANNCSYTVSFIVRRVGIDTPCWHVRANRTGTVTWANGFNYQGTTFGCD